MYVPWVCVSVRGLNKPLQPSAAVRVFDIEFAERAVRQKYSLCCTCMSFHIGMV